MKLHRRLSTGQKVAWFMLDWLRAAIEGPLEVGETFTGGKERNKNESENQSTGRGTVGKSAVVGAKDCDTNQINVQVIEDTAADTQQEFVTTSIQEGARVCTVDGRFYIGLDRQSKAISHSAIECVRDIAHANGIESFWPMVKRSHQGTYCKFSKKQLNRYFIEFAGRINIRELDTMVSIAADTEEKRLRCDGLIAGNGLDSGARSTVQRPF